MKPSDFFFDPMRLTTKIMVSQIEMMRDMQKLAMRQLDAVARDGGPLGVSMTRVEIPVPVMKVDLNETRMREAFHSIADANLAVWARMADVTQAMPGWTKWMARAPGEFWSGVFHRYPGFADVSVANDTAERPRASARTPYAQAPVAPPQPVETPRTPEPKPQFLSAPRGKADDLTRIKGIGLKLSAVLNDLGIYHFEQIASWTPENCAWIDEHLAFKGRVQREAWVEQAQRFVREAA